MSIFSCLTTPIYLDSWTQHSRFLCNIVPYSIRLYFHHQTHPQMGIVFALAQPLHSLWSSFATVLQCYIGHLLTWGVHLSSFSCFILFMGFSRQEYWSGLPFPSPVDHVLSELSTMTCPSWVALRGMAHGFIELHKAVIHVISLISFLWLWFSFCLPSDG